jgi:hypothetical protein
MAVVSTSNEGRARNSRGRAMRERTCALEDGMLLKLGIEAPAVEEGSIFCAPHVRPVSALLTL